MKLLDPTNNARHHAVRISSHKTVFNELFQDYNFAPVSNVQPTCSGSSNGGWWEPRPTQRPTYTTRPTQRPTYAPIRTIPPRTEAPEPATLPLTEPAATTAAPETARPTTERNVFISFCYYIYIVWL